MTSAYSNYSLRRTPQNEPIPGSNQVPNHAGGYVYPVDDWVRMESFLILGSEGGTYYQEEKELTKESAEATIRCIQADGIRAVDLIVRVSDSGRAAKNDPALFALALCFTFGDLTAKWRARESLPKVARIGTHLFHFAQYMENMRGWGSSVKKAIANWYDNSQRDLPYQLVKYQQRDGWSHADLITLSHPKAHGDLYDWVLGERKDYHRFQHGGPTATLSEPEIKGPHHWSDSFEGGRVPKIIEGYEKLKNGAELFSKETVAQMIVEYHLPREVVPNKFLTEAVVWEALMKTDMGYEAMIRNLGQMSKVGYLKAMSPAVAKVVARLNNQEALVKSRLHPLKILAAMHTYAQGHGFRGSGAWDVVPAVIDALNDAFYKSFGNVEPTNKRTMLALDISGSMRSPIPGMPYMSCREGAAAMALVTAAVEPNHMITGFTSGNGESKWGARYGSAMKDLAISPRQRLDGVVKYIKTIPMGGTDCSLPMRAALERKLEIDTFIIYTDNETWFGNIHPMQALREYREKMNNHAAKLVVVAMTPVSFSIADPNDAGTLDCVGFDTDTPEVISNFARE